MPLQRETVVNKALNGRELKEILRQDFAKQLESNGLLTDYIAYGRIGYEIRLTLHLQDFNRTAPVTISPSRAPSIQQVEAVPELASIETFPLSSAAPDAVVDATRLTRNITSPNAERVRAGIGVPVQRRQQDGSLIEETVKYPPDPTFGEGNIGLEDVSAATRKELGIPEPVAAMESTVIEAWRNAEAAAPATDESAT